MVPSQGRFVDALFPLFADPQEGFWRWSKGEAELTVKLPLCGEIAE